MSVSGGWCRFCERQCFVERVIPVGSQGFTQGWHGFMATCTAGRALDRQWLGGYDATSSIDPTASAGLLQREVSWQGAPRFHKPDREDELLRSQGELVRQIRKLAASEVRLREALTQVVAALPLETVRLIGSDGADGTKRMVAAAALEAARSALRSEPCGSWEKR